MKLSDMVPLDRDIEQARATDPEFRKEWDATAFARAVATQVVRYRADRGLSQKQLGELTGLTQPAVARLESGERMPTLKTLLKVSTATGLRFGVDVDGGVATLVGRRSKSAA